MVGAIGFEPTASCSRSRRATRLRHAPIIKKKYTLKQAPPGGRKRSAALGVSMAPLEPSIPPGPRLAQAAPRPDHKEKPAIEGVRPRSTFRWLHRSPRSLQDHVSPPKQAPPGGRKRSAEFDVSMAPLEPSISPGPRLAQAELHPDEADLALLIHDAKTNRGSKLGGGSRFPPDRPTLPSGSGQPHEIAQGLPCPSEDGSEPRSRVSGLTSHAPRLVSRIIGCEP